MAQQAFHANEDTLEHTTRGEDSTSIESDIFEKLGDLVNSKDDCVRENAGLVERKETVRCFVNMLNTMTDAEQDQFGREEIVNFGSTFRAAQVNIAPLESMVMGTDNLVKVMVDTNKADRDADLSTEITNLINEGVFNETEKFDQLWRTVAGEGYIAGGGPVIFEHEDSGLFPTYARNMLFPKNTTLYSEGVTYAFEKRQMTLHDLKTLGETYKNADNSFIDSDAIEYLIDQLKKNIESKGSTSSSSDYAGLDLTNDAVREDNFADDVTLDIWYYWEVRHDMEEDENFVSCVVFVDGVDTSINSSSVRAIIAQDKKAFSDPKEWLTMMVFDEEIGGEKTISTLRGLAEAQYPASAMIEDLFNLQIEGAMMTARPTLKYNDTVDVDEALDFRLGRDTFAPNGVEDFLQMPNNTHQMNPIISHLMSTVAGMSSSDKANTGRGQELRQQALERQQNSSVLTTNRINKAYKKLDRLLTIMVGRLLKLTPDAGTEDFETFRWFQEAVDKKIVEVYKLEEEEQDDLTYSKKALDKAKEIREKLAEKSWGRYVNFRVRANRAVTGFDRPAEEENADFLLQMLESGRVPTQFEPAVIKTALILKTQNPDIADIVAADPEPIKSSELERAAMEWAVIMRRASAGEIYPINPRDIHEDHFESHLVDMISMVNENGLRPWDQLMVAQFTAGVEHTNQHIIELQKIKAKRNVAAQLFPQLQAVLADAASIIQLLSKEEEEQVDENDPDIALKRAQAQKIYMDMDLMGRKYGLDLEERKNINQQRIDRTRQGDERQALMERQQFINEVQANQKLALDAMTKIKDGREKNIDTQNRN